MPMMVRDSLGHALPDHAMNFRDQIREMLAEHECDEHCSDWLEAAVVIATEKWSTILEQSHDPTSLSMLWQSSKYQALQVIACSQPQDVGELLDVVRTTPDAGAPLARRRTHRTKPQEAERGSSNESFRNLVIHFVASRLIIN